MPRRSTPKREKRDWRYYAAFALNAVVAASMVLGTIFLFTGAPRPAPPVPTIVPPTASAGGATPTPASAPTNVSPASTATPVPKPDAHNLASPTGQVAQNNSAAEISAALLFCARELETSQA